MDRLTEAFRELPLAHHAYGIESFSCEIQTVTALFDRSCFSYIFEKEYETFKIDDARSIKSLQSEKTEQASLFVIKFFHITHEAQNALLKVLEEPKADTYFILIFPYAHELLATLRSRLFLLSLGGVLSELQLAPYLALSLEDRFAYNKKQELGKSSLAHLLHETECHAKEQGSVEILQDIFLLKKYLEANGSSGKMILDHLAIILG